MRKLATIRTIAEIQPIPNADAIEAVRVDGWWVVAKKGEFLVGDLAVYFEIDSWIPETIAPFLSKGRELNGVKGERLRTVRLRGQISQGLLMPLYNCDEMRPAMSAFHQTRPYDPDEDHFDVTEILGIQKYEPNLPAALQGLVRSTFPAWLRKTDQERIQNCFRSIEKHLGEMWVGEEKLDGSSMTVGVQFTPEGPDLHVCSRNLSLKLEDENNSFVKKARQSGVIDALTNYGHNIALSGELIGEGIQGNRYKISGQEWYIFDVFLVDEQRYCDVFEREGILVDLQQLGFKVKKVPALYSAKLDGATVKSLLEHAEAKTVLGSGAEREGIVWKLMSNGEISFKAISNKFLLKGGEEL